MVRRRMRLTCTALRCGGIWRAKLSRFCTICLVRCASCRITRRSLRALSGISGFSMSRSAKPRIAVKGLFTSWATPETSWPTAAIFSACTSFPRRSAEAVMSVMTTTMLLMEACSSRMGLRFTVLERGFMPAAVGIADKAGGVSHQNEALSVAENLAGEIALPMQFRLIGVHAGNVQHQPADLQQAPKIVVHAESIDENVNRRTILAAKLGFKVTQMTIFFHGLRVAVALAG